MADPRPLTRNDLAEFLPSQRAIRAFEKLFELIPSSLDTNALLIQEASIDAGIAAAKATQALELLDRLVVAVELLALAPQQTKSESDNIVVEVASTPPYDDLRPTIPLGTLGMQQADRVAITGGAVLAQLKNNQTVLLESVTALTDGVGASAGTITNAPAAGNPTKWVGIIDNGVTRYIPAW